MNLKKIKKSDCSFVTFANNCERIRTLPTNITHDFHLLHDRGSSSNVAQQNLQSGTLPLDLMCSCPTFITNSTHSFLPSPSHVASHSWPGTVVDCGVFSPTGAFMELFSEEGVEVTSSEARGPMGMHKRVLISSGHLLNMCLLFDHAVHNTSQC